MSEGLVRDRIDELQRRSESTRSQIYGSMGTSYVPSTPRGSDGRELYITEPVTIKFPKDISGYELKSPALRLVGWFHDVCDTALCNGQRYVDRESLITVHDTTTKEELEVTDALALNAVILALKELHEEGYELDIVHSAQKEQYRTYKYVGGKVIPTDDHSEYAIYGEEAVLKRGWA